MLPPVTGDREPTPDLPDLAAVAEPQPAPPPAAVKAVRPEAPETRRFRGFVDGVDSEWRLCGWAHDLEGTLLTVELVEDGVAVASGIADGFRQDLLDAGFGDGRAAFYVPLPPALFDAAFHRLQVFAISGTRREPIHEPFGVVLPQTAARLTAMPARKIWEHVTGEPAAAPRPDGAAIDEIADAFQQLGLRFGHSTALRLLYVYVLRRPIDNDGLMSRLVRLNGNIAEYRAIVAEVINSNEAALIHEPTGYRTLDPLNYLSAWLDERFSIIGVRNEPVL